MLSQQEINHRLTQLRNYERLYPKLKHKYEEVKIQNNGLKIEITELRTLIVSQAKLIEKLSLRIEELEGMVFGRKKKRPQGSDDTDHGTSNPPSRTPRSCASFRRAQPNESEVTVTTPHLLTHCPDCNAALTRRKDIVRYLEDMLLPIDTANLFKKVEKLVIATGYCSLCQRRVSAVPIPRQNVSLGENVRQFIAYANVVLRLTYAQTRSFLKDVIHLDISDGEMSHILAEQARRARPEYEQLKANIRGQPGAHYDETAWKVRDGTQGNYGWVMTGTETTDAIFQLGVSRGKGNAEELKGDAPDTQVAITDDYGAYRTLFEAHQLCWAHPLRKLRDLASSPTLSEEKQSHCRTVYKQFAGVYGAVRHVLSKPFNVDERRAVRTNIKAGLITIAQPHRADPAKLAVLKETLHKNIGSYLTCLDYEGIPPDNNKAERALRHLVLKRKNSYGSKTQKGADTMTILSSVLLSLWWRRPQNFFAEYARMLKVG